MVNLLGYQFFQSGFRKAPKNTESGSLNLLAYLLLQTENL